MTTTEASSLIAVVIPLTPIMPDQPIPQWLGRAAQAWLLSSVRQHDSALAMWLHEGTQPRRPYTIGVMKFDSQLMLRITSLHAALTELLVSVLLPELQTLTLGKISFTAAPMLTSHDWAARNSFEDLARQAFERNPFAPIKLEFATPTAFHRSGLTVPLPIPELVFGSLIQAWNSASPVSLPVPLGDFFDTNIALMRHRIHTRQALISAKEKHTGFVGRTDFGYVNTNKLQIDSEQARLAMQSLQLLARFAVFAGVGIRTTVGMGQVRLID
jgi:CRISPR-associated endoribonuclease Cas6